ncbi:MAG: hypothetical protein M3163_00540 [Actinomycetota bacterium]|nr:hypothetical protein [Actinomycetota bacterium]
MRLRSALQKAGAAAILVGGLAVAGPAHAQTPNYVGVTPPGLGAVDASTGSRTGAVDASTGSRTGAVLSTQGQVSPAQVSAQASSGRLAFTGSDVIGLATIGAASIGIGAIAVRSSRRRSAENTVDGAARAL